MTDFIVNERCGSTGDVVSYIKQNNEILEIKLRKRFIHNFRGITTFFKEIILPRGYPESVSDDYIEYQLWDTFQAFCSTIIGAFKTRAVLKGVGVGDGSANALSAAITWILKDGTGMFGRICFAWWKGCVYTAILQVGIAGGATRAAITHHQAIKDNMAEISAKDGSQETVVNLIGSFGSIFLLNYFQSSRAEWILILTLMVLHLYTNFLAVKALVFKTFNKERLAIVLKTYFTIGTVLNPVKVNAKESVLIGRELKVKDICGFNILLGERLKPVLNQYSIADIKMLESVYENKNYMLFVNGKTQNIYVALGSDVSSEDLIAAYFHAFCLGIATSVYNCLELDIYSKRQLHHSTPITRLYTYMKAYEKYSNNFRNIPPGYLPDFNEFVRQEHSMFFTALNINAWTIASHCLEVGEYRIEFNNKKTT